MKKTLNIPFDKFNLKNEYFRNQSKIHDKNHVYRVMYHTLVLGNEFGDNYVTKLAFCSAFIHDMERLHDGFCTQHGEWAAMYALPKFEKLFLSLGLDELDLDIIAYASTMHSLPDTGFMSGIYGDVAKILKDADALDRVRLGNLDPTFLRFNFSHNYIPFAHKLFIQTENENNIETFAQVIEIAGKLLKKFGN